MPSESIDIHESVIGTVTTDKLFLKKIMKII